MRLAGYINPIDTVPSRVVPVFYDGGVLLAAYRTAERDELHKKPVSIDAVTEFTPEQLQTLEPIDLERDGLFVVSPGDVRRYSLDRAHVFFHHLLESGALSGAEPFARLGFAEDAQEGAAIVRSLAECVRASADVPAFLDEWFPVKRDELLARFPRLGLPVYWARMLAEDPESAVADTMISPWSNSVGSGTVRSHEADEWRNDQRLLAAFLQSAHGVQDRDVQIVERKGSESVAAVAVHSGAGVGPALYLTGPRGRRLEVSEVYAARKRLDTFGLSGRLHVIDRGATNFDELLEWACRTERSLCSMDDLSRFQRATWFGRGDGVVIEARVPGALRGSSMILDRHLVVREGEPRLSFGAFQRIWGGLDSSSKLPAPWACEVSVVSGIATFEDERGLRSAIDRFPSFKVIRLNRDAPAGGVPLSWWSRFRRDVLVGVPLFFWWDTPDRGVSSSEVASRVRASAGSLTSSDPDIVTEFQFAPLDTVTLGRLSPLRANAVVSSIGQLEIMRSVIDSVVGLVRH